MLETQRLVRAGSKGGTWLFMVLGKLVVQHMSSILLMKVC